MNEYKKRQIAAARNRRSVFDNLAEDAARVEARSNRGCGCGYWDGTKLIGPQLNCLCDAATELRAQALAQTRERALTRARARARARAKKAAEARKKKIDDEPKNESEHTGGRQ